MAAPIIWDDKKKVTEKRVTVDPITRLEGHGKIEIFLDDKGDVTNAYWQVPEVRGFERFCIGRRVTELAQITARLCGVCPGAHHLAATKAIDGCYNSKPTEAAFHIRDTFYHAHFVHSHIAHFYALAAPDFVYNGVALPPKGTEIGVTEKCLCDECPREKAYARITKIYEPYQVDVDPHKCLMDQGILCLGPATVGGCNAKCTRAGQPCRGCYGPTHFVEDHGSSAFSAIASLFPVLDEDPTCDEEKIIEVMSTIKDPLGYFYAFTLGKSLINRSVSEEKTA